MAVSGFLYKLFVKVAPSLDAHDSNSDTFIFNPQMIQEQKRRYRKG
jgi:hypothetical protein